MSATDDAHSINPPAVRDRARRGRLVLLAGAALGAVAGAALAFALADRVLPDRPARWECRVSWTGAPPTSEPDWPAGAAVHSAGDGSLRVRAALAADAEALAERLSTVDRERPEAMAVRRAALAAGWRRAMTIGPMARQSEPGETAARLRAAAAVARGLTGGVADAEPDRAEASRARAVLASAEAATDAAARAGLAAATAEALEAEARAESSWLASIAPGGAEEVDARWSARAHRRSTDWVVMAEALERDVTPFQRELVAAYLPAFALERVRATPDPSSIAPWPGPAPVGRAQPRMPAWLAILGAGALAGSLAGAACAALASFVAARVRRRPRAPSRDRAAQRPAPEQREAFLHVVSGSDRERTVRGLIELAARHVARGHRVLLVDGGRRLRLHDAFAAEARYGLIETLAGDMPLLTLVQTAGTRGVYVLTHGQEGAEPAWASLGRLLAAARPYFGRVILALEPAAPSTLGDALRGRVLEAWWADRATTLVRAAQAFEQRIGIALEIMDLDAVTKPTLEALADRAAVLIAGFGAPGIEVPPLELPPPPAPFEAVVHDPVVLDCDLQVRERLRFLIWMRRIQAEGPGGVAQPQTR